MGGEGQVFGEGARGKGSWGRGGRQTATWGWRNGQVVGALARGNGSWGRGVRLTGS